MSSKKGEQSTDCVTVLFAATPSEASLAVTWEMRSVLCFVIARQRIATVSGHLHDIISYNRY